MPEKSTQTCISCHMSNLPEDYIYCPNCSFVLNSNFCSEDTCLMNDGADEHLGGFDESYCYCPECGNKTTYYLAGLIEPVPFN